MLCKVIFLMVLWNYVFAQPPTNTTDNERSVRQVKIECCPCDKRHRQDQARFSTTNIDQARVDDCPCRFRNADSEDAQSILYPNIVRGFQPSLRDSDVKDEQQSVLQPEVGLASSMLETLKEVTDEEYRNAVLRDAARSAVREVLRDAAVTTQETPKNVVTIIVKSKDNPDLEDDVISSGTHVQETRCAHPFEILSLPTKNPRINRPKFTDIDSSAGASNIFEKEVEPYKPDKPLLNLFRSKPLPPLPKTDIDKKIQNLFLTDLQKLRIPDLKSKLNTENNNVRDSEYSPTNLIKQFPKSQINENPKFGDFLRSPLKNIRKMQKGEIVPPSTLMRKKYMEKLNLPRLRAPFPDLNKHRISGLPTLSDLFTNSKSEVNTQPKTNRNENHKVETQISDAVTSPSEMVKNIDTIRTTVFPCTDEQTSIESISSSPANEVKQENPISEENIETDDRNESDDGNCFSNKDSSERSDQANQNVVSNGISHDDLEKLSNNLLNLSYDKTTPRNINDQDQEDLQESQSENIESKESAEVPKEPINLTEEPSKIENESKESPDVSAQNSMNSLEIFDNIVKKNEGLQDLQKGEGKQKEENVCDATEKSNSESQISSNEMSVGASEHVSDFVPAPRQNSVIQPTSLFAGLNNLFNPTPLPSISSLFNTDPNIPILDIGSDTSNILNLFAKEAESDVSHELPVKSKDLFTASSKPKSQSVLPLGPLEDVTLDIFQLNPLLPKSSIIPTLNLNSFKAKLPIPKQLKPLQLESSLGNKNGVLGASLSVRQDKLDSAMAGSKKIPTLKKSNYLENIPSLEELRGKLKESIENLLQSRAAQPLHNIQDTLGSSHIDSIADNIRSHTENTVKNIQKSLQTSITTASNKNFFGETLPHPQDILDEISLRREDLNDKLKGVHYDLNDRLESFRDKIIEQTKLSPLRLSGMNNDMINLRSKSNRDNLVGGLSLASFLNPEPSLTSTNRRPHYSRKSSPRVDSDRLSHIPKQAERKNVKSIKMTHAASETVPKTVALPKTNKRTRPLQELKLVPLANPRISQIEKKRPDINSDLGMKQANFLKSPVTIPQDQTTNRQRVKISHPIQSQLLKKDSNSASLSHALKTKSMSGDRFAQNKQNTEEKSKTALFPAKKTELKSLALERILKKAKERTNAPLAWPKYTESSFLNKVKEALRARTLDNKIENLNARNNQDIDMLRSASEKQVITHEAGELMSGNSHYKCKMVCTKDL